MPVDVIGIGDASLDIYLEVDHVPGQREKIIAKSLAYYPGGMVANFSAALSRLGNSCGFHGPVGDDEFGRTTLADLAAKGVDTRYAIIRPGGRTYFGIVMLDGSGEKALVVVPTNCIQLEPDEVSEDWIAQARHLHTTGFAQATALRAVALAKKHGLTVSIDLEPAISAKRDELRSLLAQVDVLLVNRRAVRLLGDEDSICKNAELILTYGPKVVCVTMGEAGSLVVSDTEVFEAKAFPVPVVDSTGAGDCFAAGFVHGLIRGWSLRRIAMFASAVGALAVMHRGGRSGTPTSQEVVEFMVKRGISLPE